MTLALLTTLSLFCLGSRLGPRLPLAVAGLVGLMVLCLAMGVLGALGWIHTELSLILLLLPILVGGGAFWRKLKRLELPVRDPIFWLLCVFLICKWANTLIPQTQGDPLYYHLPSAYHWARLGEIRFLSWLPWSLQGGLGEYYYTFLASLVPDRVSLLILCQMVHGFWGYVMGASLLYLLARTRLSVRLSLLTVLAFVTFPHEIHMLVRAKNDGFVLAGSIGALWAANEFLTRGRCEVLLGLALGFVVSCKMTGAFFVLPLACVVLMAKRRLGWWAFLTVLVGGVTPLRNYLFTENPFFPAMGGVFDSPYLNDFLRAEVARWGYVPGSFWEILVSHGDRFLWAKLCFAFGFLYPWWRSRSATALMVLVLGMSMLLIGFTGKGQFARFGYPLYALLSLQAGLGLAYWADRMGRVWAQGLFLVTTLLGSYIDVPFGRMFNHHLPYFLEGAGPRRYLEAHLPSFRFHEAVNRHVPKGRIFSFFENENLFLDAPLSVAENEITASWVYQAPTYEAIVAELHRHSFSYVQVPPLSAHRFDRLYRDPRFARDFQLVLEVSGYKLFRVPSRVGQP